MYNIQTKTHSMRYKTKFTISQINFNEIKNIIKLDPAVFEEAYLKRNINNIYFDDSNLTSIYWFK
tara:strand:- start:202 stop:396 length:195 start_codon:yes stop_codon:yes gene_type:complete